MKWYLVKFQGWPSHTGVGVDSVLITSGGEMKVWAGNPDHAKHIVDTKITEMFQYRRWDLQVKILSVEPTTHPDND